MSLHTLHKHHRCHRRSSSTIISQLCHKLQVFHSAIFSGAGKKKICLKDGNLKNYIINQLENLKKANDKSFRTLAETVMQWSE